MLSHFRPAAVLLVGMTLLTGLAYPLAMTGLAQAIAPAAANGSLIVRGDRVIGSALLAQDFTGAAYLHPRASASGFVATGSYASNLGPSSAKLQADVAARRADFEAANGAPAPIDAVTVSASGLDPDISPANARAQAGRIAQARALPVADVWQVIDAQIAGPWLGLYGQPRVNVLMANLALDAAFPAAPAGQN